MGVGDISGGRSKRVFLARRLVKVLVAAYGNTGNPDMNDPDPRFIMTLVKSWVYEPHNTTPNPESITQQ